MRGPEAAHMYQARWEQEVAARKLGDANWKVRGGRSTWMARVDRIRIRVFTPHIRRTQHTKSPYCRLQIHIQHGIYMRMDKNIYDRAITRPRRPRRPRVDGGYASQTPASWDPRSPHH